MRFFSLKYMVVLLLTLLSGCKEDEGNDLRYLSFVSRTPLTIPETSGLAVFDNASYLTVSDSISKVYLLDLEGNIIRSLGFKGNNLEGVTYDPAGPFIYVVEEKNNEIVKLDTTGQEISRFSVMLENKDPRHGLEGITLNPGNGHLYVVSEKDPALLFELKTDGTVLAKHALGFAEDYSSVYYDPYEDLLWILSDDSQTLTKTTLDGQPLVSYVTGIKKAEGVIVDSQNATIYLITDDSGSFYVMSF